MHVMVLGLRGFPDVQGGVETHAEHIYPILVQLGCHVDVVVRTAYMPKDLKTWQGIHFHRLWAPRQNGLEAFFHTLAGVLYAGIKRPDVLHIHAIGPAIWVPLARMLGLTVVVTHHGPDYDREKWGAAAKFLLRSGERFGMRFASERIVISKVIHNLVKQKHHCDSVVIPNGVSLPDIPESINALKTFDLKPGQYVLLVSRVVPEKRHLDLIDAFSQADLRDWKLVIVGAIDPSDAYCTQVVKAAKNSDSVVLADFQTGQALQELYANAGVFVLPSSHEGLPIALLEALSYGIPTLASNIPANLEVGLAAAQYFPLGDVKALAHSLRDIQHGNTTLADRAHWRNWVNKKYNWHDVANQTLAVYKMVVS